MIAIGIATANRRTLLAQTLDYIVDRVEKNGLPILICPAHPSDAPISDAGIAAHGSILVPSVRGLPAQRNAILASSSADILMFIDDDFLPAPDYVIEVERLFGENPDIVVATGRLLADGATSGGMDFEEGARLLATVGPNNGGAPVSTYGAYGCNMVIRMAPVREHSLRFDENLPLYGWQEDIDFSRQLAPYGRIVRSPRLRGVHLGTKRSGRTPGKQLGYSQIANPYYLIRKGTMSKQFAWRLIRNNVAGNLLRFLRPEPTVDRRGRLLGNAVAVTDILLGRCNPKRILEF